MMKRYDLSQLFWELAGYTPNAWLHWVDAPSMTRTAVAEVAAIRASVPGSVQQALLDTDRISDWYNGMNSMQCEWVENRHWVYETKLPDAWLCGGAVQLHALGLDYSGWIYMNGVCVSQFRGGHKPVTVDLTAALQTHDNKLRIILDTPPRYLGYTGFTSRFTDWKVRFSYSWDWMVRLVTLGIWDDLLLTVRDGAGFAGLDVRADADPRAGTGLLTVHPRVTDAGDTRVRVTLRDGARVIHTETHPADACNAHALEWRSLPVDLWWPHTHGAQPLYTVDCVLEDAAGAELDRLERRVGFRNVRWERCEGAPETADPWLCVVNDQPVFLQGVNWTPIRPTFHDLKPKDYRKYVALYRELGANLLRVWGGAILEREPFYRYCDEMGIMVWQELPLSSSTFDNWPPEDPTAIKEMVEIGESYVERRGHHASLILWCGGNELHRVADGDPTGTRVSADANHPMLDALQRMTAARDPRRRYVPSSPSGPRFFYDARESGQGVHWDIHGPWRVEGTMDDWQAYWDSDDAMLRSEVGCPGPSNWDSLSQFTPVMSYAIPKEDIPPFRRPIDPWWWGEWNAFLEEHGCEPESVEEYVRWFSQRQADALRIAVHACKRRFPRCGGVILWMGHDCFPCPANTSIIDYLGEPKQAYEEVQKVYRSPGA